MSNKKAGKGFSEQPERVSDAARKGGGSVSGNLKKDPGRAVEAGHRSHERKRGSGEES